MSSEDLKVYLDHLIARENLRYKRSRESVSDTTPTNSIFRMDDLYKGKRPSQDLRKPDFQRATWAWTPEDCVSSRS